MENTRHSFDAAGAFNKLSEEEQKDIKNHLLELCQCYENPDFWKYNTWEIYYELCDNKISDNYPQEIKEIGNYLQIILEKIKKNRREKRDILVVFIGKEVADATLFMGNVKLCI